MRATTLKEYADMGINPRSAAGRAGARYMRSLNKGLMYCPEPRRLSSTKGFAFYFARFNRLKMATDKKAA
jgi:hypothetical protein